MASPLADLTGEFVKYCTIRAYSRVQDDSGEYTETWSDLPGHQNLSCSVSRGDGAVKGEQVRGNMTVTFNPLKVTLFDSYPNITTKHQAVIGGVSYEILDVYWDSLGYSTVLQVVAVC